MLMTKTIQIGSVKAGGDSPLLLIAGPCVIESRECLRRTASVLKETAEKLSLGLVFKSSFDKANRSSLSAYRGPGLERGLELLAEVKEEFKIPVLSDVHETSQARPAARVLD